MFDQLAIKMAAQLKTAFKEMCLDEKEILHKLLFIVQLTNSSTTEQKEFRKKKLNYYRTTRVIFKVNWNKQISILPLCIPKPAFY